jgi:hypothetical protein
MEAKDTFIDTDKEADSLFRQYLIADLAQQITD